MFDKKGQGAMEYLMTYGWAILVVMIVGIVMWQLGIFNLGSTAVTSSGFAKIKPQLASCKVTTAGAFSCLFTNGAGTGITITGMDATYGDETCVTSAAVAAGTDVAVGDNFLITDVMGDGETITCDTGAAGEPYVVDVTFSYSQNIAGTSVTHTDFGKVRGPYEAA